MTIDVAPRYAVGRSQGKWPFWHMTLRLLVAFGPLFLSICAVHSAQAEDDDPAAGYPKQLRYEENYSYLADPTKRRDFWDPIKFIPLSDSKDVYLSLGGEWRERFEATDNPTYGLAGLDHDSVLTQRLMLSGDLHIGDEFRTFVQLGSHLAWGRSGFEPLTDRDKLDLQQAFFDLNLAPTEGSTGTMRIGRQEIFLGSGRYVNAREGPNVRRSFDGARAMLRSQSVNLDAFWTRPVALEKGVFDDEWSENDAFWGLYATVPIDPDVKFDLYYYGFEKEFSAYNAGAGDERRHTLGARIWGAKRSFDYDTEALFQFGEFENKDIRAWAISSNIGFTFQDLPLRPRIGIKLGAESGDGDPDDGRIETFNPLFPNNGYFSEAAIGAPMNDLDVQPNITLQLADGLNLRFAWDSFWREQTEDAVYGPGLMPIRGTAGGGESYVGYLVTTHLQWQPDRHLELNADYTHFEAGGAIKEAGGKDIDFMMFSAAYRF